MLLLNSSSFFWNEHILIIFASTQFNEVSEPLCCDSSEIKNLYINFPNQEVKSLVSPFFSHFYGSRKYIFHYSKLFFLRFTFCCCYFFPKKKEARAVMSQIRIIYYLFSIKNEAIPLLNQPNLFFARKDVFKIFIITSCCGFRKLKPANYIIKLHENYKSLLKTTSEI